MTVTALTPTPHQKVLGTTQIRADVFPANVHYSFADNPYPKSRVLVTADEIIVLVDGRPSAPNVAYSGRLEDLSGDRRMLVATTADGTITVSRAQGCGCGSRLKSYRPFQRVVRMAAR